MLTSWSGAIRENELRERSPRRTNVTQGDTSRARDYFSW
jgi:hypothetical protein